MKQLPLFPNRYWLKFETKPVIISDYDPRSTNIAKKYIQNISQILTDYPIDAIYHRGSTALQISGKGDIEIGIIPQADYWFDTIVFLSQHFRGLGNLDDDYCRFNDNIDGYDIEIILMKGYTAHLDQKLHEFLSSRPEFLREYEQVKQANAYSQREYNRQKDTFFRKIIALIP